MVHRPIAIEPLSSSNRDMYPCIARIRDVRKRIADRQRHMLPVALAQECNWPNRIGIVGSLC